MANKQNIQPAALLNSTSRVESPFIRIRVGDYTFGVYEESKGGVSGTGMYRSIPEKYPNYVDSLEVKKINGTVNQYTLNIKYPVTSDSDPNFFDKLFSSIAQNRLISIDYGDFSVPEYIYKDEEAIIENITENIDIKSSIITYTVNAVSTAKLTLSGSYNFPAKTVKPSDEIYRILYTENSKYHLLDIFTGMKDENLVRSNHLIDSDDRTTTFIPTQSGVSALEYINTLVSYMNPTAESRGVKKANVYSLTTYEDTSGIYGGPYFMVKKIEQNLTTLNQICTYTIDIGYPTANIVTDFQIKQTDNWSMYYSYNQELNNSDYIKTIDDKGNLKYEFSPQLTGKKHTLDEKDRTWWTKATEFPIQATLKIKGLLKPAVLMSYVNLNVWMYGVKHITSGYYIITSQTDSISSNGYYTTLELTRVAAGESY